MRRGSRWARASVVAIATLLVAAANVAAAVPALAHDTLVASTPEAGSTITELPAAFSVTTNEALLDFTGEADGFALRVHDAAGLYYGDGCLTVDGASLVSGATLGEAGDYTVVWQVVSGDGHPISGEFGFNWLPANPSQVSTGKAELPECGATPPKPTAQVTAGPEPAETPVPISALDRAASAGSSMGLWIGGTLVVVSVAAVTALVVRRRARR